jgi:hypothetical protein
MYMPSYGLNGHGEAIATSRGRSQDLGTALLPQLSDGLVMSYDWTGAVDPAQLLTESE